MDDLIEKYNLVPHPEGGFFREVYRSDMRVTTGSPPAARCAATHIYFLLTSKDISRFHMVKHDEIWNFYKGAPIKLIKFDGCNISEETIGQDCENQFTVVKGGTFQAAVSMGEQGLAGCSVAPGFEFEDFSMLRDNDEMKRKLEKDFPGYTKYL